MKTESVDEKLGTKQTINKDKDKKERRAKGDRNARKTLNEQDLLKEEAGQTASNYVDDLF